MKTSFFLLLLPLFFCVFGIKSSQVLAYTSSFEAVLDTSGNKVRTGQEYYILPGIRGSGGGLTLGANRYDSCPFDVVQDPDEASNGLPLIFTPVDPKKEIISVSTDLNFKFSAVTICPQSTVWKLGSYEAIATTGGVEGNPGRSTLSNWFMIEKYEDGYKLVFCPYVCKTCRPLCGDLGIYTVDGVRRLGISEEPFKVMFKTVNSQSHASM